MRALKAYNFKATKEEQLATTRTTADWLRLRGTGKQPDPPRDVQFLPGSRGGLLIWRLPLRDVNISGWRVFIGDEDTPYSELADKGIRQKFVELTASATSPTQNLFVCSVSPLGIESVKVHVQAKPLDEAAAVPNPVPPTDYGNESAGGADRDRFDVRLHNFKGDD